MESSSTQRRILLISTDGLRPDQFDPELMPAYAALMARGTRLTAHHAIFPSVTRAIISAIGTGCTPGKHGVVSSNVRIDGLAPDDALHTDNADSIAALDRLTGGHAIMQPTLGDLLEQQGVRMGVAGAQTSGGGALLARHQRFPKIITSTTYGDPQNLEIRDLLGGEPPPMDMPTRNPHDLYAAKGVADVFLDDDSLRLMTLWLAEPDYALHRYGLGSPQVRDALKVCNEALAYIVDGIEKRDLSDQIDILLISDHGHSSVDQQGTLPEQLDRARQELGDRMPDVSTADNNIYPVPGASGPSADELQPLVEWIQQQPWAGALFGGTPEISRLRGIIPLAELWNGSSTERTPLLAISPFWSDDVNDAGVPGTVRSLVKRGGNLSTHGSASPYDMHAMAYAIGPSFHEGRETNIPSGATDLAPTILTLLGVEPPGHMDGRVLWEIMKQPGGEPGEVSEEVIQPETTADGFNPILHRHRVGTTTYVHQVSNGGPSS